VRGSSGWGGLVVGGRTRVFGGFVFGMGLGVSFVFVFCVGGILSFLLRFWLGLVFGRWGARSGKTFSNGA